MTSLAAWLRSPAGSALVRGELALAERALADVFGYQLLLVGDSAYEPLLAASRTQHTHRLAPWEAVPAESEERAPGEAPDASPNAAVVADPSALPIAGDSVDAIVLPHVLEFSARPHEALRECERILVGDGHLVLMGFNPWGAIGLWRACLRRRSDAPWAGQFLAAARIRDWLALLGFDVLSAQRSFFRPPLTNARWLERLVFFERAGELFFPYLASAYVVVARKRLSTMTPIRPRWRPPRLVAVGMAEPTARAAGADSRRGRD